MATINGTSGNDRLIGTTSDDLIIANGGQDKMLGNSGADIYQLRFGTPIITPLGVTEPYYTINETNSGDASIDTITGVRDLHQTSILGFEDFTQFLRAGTNGQNLIVNTAAKRPSFRSPAIEDGVIKIINQFNVDIPGAQIELLSAGGITYNLVTTNTGTASHDILTGWKYSDVIHAGAGNDYLSGGNRRDYLYGEDGNDTIFGERGSDILYGGAGIDAVFGGLGNDKLYGGDGNDRLEGGEGKDTIKGQNGNDRMLGGDGDDHLVGGSGDDVLYGEAGNDKLVGGGGSDLYIVHTAGSDSDIILENDRAFGTDTIQLQGFSSTAEGVRSIDLQILGDDLVITYENSSLTPGQIGQITIQNQLVRGRYDAIEQVTFGSGSTDKVFHIADLKGDQFLHSVHFGPDEGGEDIVLGTAGADQIYAGVGLDLVFGGASADRFIYHDEEGNGGHETILDFNLAEDILDFTEIKNLTQADLTIAENSDGNAVISGGTFGYVELKGIAIAEVTDNIFAFRDAPAPEEPLPPTGDGYTLEDALRDPRFSSIDFNILEVEGDQFLGEEGGHPNDIVLGTAREDDLYGGQGIDILVGDASSDIFVYKDEGTAGGHELIIDFKIAEDRIDFSKIFNLSRADVTIVDNAIGHAEISGASFGSIELAGVTASQLTDSLFIF